MHIKKGLDKLDQSNFYICKSKWVAKFLVKQGIPLLGMTENKFIFSETYELEMALTKLPFYLKIFT